ncbi:MULTISPECIES: DUF2867 domain-containing protein [Pacificibacter]|uniref:DUF2867 domain-containing protein n=1 Tax=Pacificibacter TaxID=1042323 RepID=UPI001C09376E|nr:MULTISPECIES: DUF2867 domain-containing protein [Pacificibacter]MBU2935395.1 DUF2867 domain-containing protein [Pacificibacter marinus]MDO6615550.1 DUF2867 domain-containing protein [Pacificibacter sp. 1_MG-2023]
MTKITTPPHPKHARIWDSYINGDFIDNYSVPSSMSPKDAAKVGLSMPKWATALMTLRNTIVRPLGLKTDDIGKGQGTLFPITYEDADQLILGADDSHLNFRISIVRHDDRIHMATWVHRDNTLGRAYLTLIMPFHVLIVRDCIKRIARHKDTATIAS